MHRRIREKKGEESKRRKKKEVVLDKEREVEERGVNEREKKKGVDKDKILVKEEKKTWAKKYL